ncbi:STXA protein, partial [Polypterus senegalus]
MAERPVSITTAGLGRPFQLGMLYDCRSDQLVPDFAINSGGTTNATALGDILETHEISPFSQKKLEGWLCSLQTEIRVIEALINGMEDSNISLLTGRFDRIEPLILQPNIKYIVSFNFNLLSNENKILITMENYFKSEEQSGVRSTDMMNNDDWVYSRMDFNKIRLRRQLFLDFASNNQQNKATKFVVTSRPVETEDGISVLLCCQGEMHSSDFEPLQLQMPQSIKNIESVSRNRTVPPTSWIKRDIKVPGAVRKHTERQWRSQMTRVTEKCFTLEGLQRSTQYDVRYAAISEAGVGPPSEVISVNTGEPGMVLNYIDDFWLLENFYFIWDLSIVKVFENYWDEGSCVHHHYD